jgi:hypothetical protein
MHLLVYIVTNIGSNHRIQTYLPNVHFLMLHVDDFFVLCLHRRWHMAWAVPTLPGMLGTMVLLHRMPKTRLARAQTMVQWFATSSDVDQVRFT